MYTHSSHYVAHTHARHNTWNVTCPRGQTASCCTHPVLGLVNVIDLPDRDNIRRIEVGQLGKNDTVPQGLLQLCAGWQFFLQTGLHPPVEQGGMSCDSHMTITALINYLCMPNNMSLMNIINPHHEYNYLVPHTHSCSQILRERLSIDGWPLQTHYRPLQWKSTVTALSETVGYFRLILFHIETTRQQLLRDYH